MDVLLLYSRQEAARLLNISISSLEVMVGRGMLKPIHKGRRVMFSRAEIEREAKKEHSAIWPPKDHGKTRRYLAEAS